MKNRRIFEAKAEFKSIGAVVMLGLLTGGMAYSQAIDATWIGNDGNMLSVGNWEVGGNPATRLPNQAGDTATVGAGSSVNFPNQHWDSVVNVTNSIVTVSGEINRRANYNLNGVTLQWADAGANASFGVPDTTLFNVGAGNLTISQGSTFDWRMRMQLTGLGGITINSSGTGPITYQRGSYAYQGDTLIQNGRLIIGQTDQNIATKTFSFQGSGDSMNQIYGSGNAETQLTIRDPLLFDLSGFNWNQTLEREWLVIDWSTIANNDSGFEGATYFIGSSNAPTSAWTLLDPTADPFKMNESGSGRIWEYVDGGLTWNFDESLGTLTVIPEPTTISLIIAFGLLAIVIVRRRKRITV